MNIPVYGPLGLILCSTQKSALGLHRTALNLRNEVGIEVQPRIRACNDLITEREPNSASYDIVVAMPGFLLGDLQRNTSTTDNLQYMVLGE